MLGPGRYVSVLSAQLNSRELASRRVSALGDHSCTTPWILIIFPRRIPIPKFTHTCKVPLVQYFVGEAYVLTPGSAVGVGEKGENLPRHEMRARRLARVVGAQNLQSSGCVLSDPTRILGEKSRKSRPYD